MSGFFATFDFFMDKNCKKNVFFKKDSDVVWDISWLMNKVLANLQIPTTFSLKICYSQKCNIPPPLRK